ncbi:hypothetical protein ACFV1W_24365 [Kitasatospora sp. NPDC059648]|uniref:hypothetical protein n=1 Tax=Kitasatospora sp. NPDC059648 TaxID=3346894 RepID=UPI003677168F
MLSQEMHRLRLGQIFAADVPLGLFQELPLSCFRSSSGLGRLHGEADCAQLRSAPAVHRSEVPLTFAVGELCTHCAWPVPAGHPLVAFAEAVSSLTPLRTGAEFQAGPVAEGAGRADSRDAREGRRRRWRRLQAQLLESHTVAAAYPWLALWVEPMQVSLAGAVDRARRDMALLLDEAVLLDTACAAALPAPALGEGGSALVGPGPSGSWLVQEAWACWQQECATDWGGLEAGRSAASAVVYEAFGSRRRGRTEALDALDLLVDEWNGRARALAAQHAAVPRRSLTVEFPPLVRTHNEEEEDQLTRWEAGVLAVYQVAVHWSAGSIDLLVPGPVADQLLRNSSLAAVAEDHEHPGP